MPTDWEWWFGHVDNEGYSESAKTREEAIKLGLRDTVAGEQFQIIEARSSTAQKYESGHYDIVPFTHTRNHEVLTNGLQLLAEITVSPSEGRA